MSHSHDDEIICSSDFLPVCRWLDTCEQLLIARGCETCEFTRRLERNGAQSNGTEPTAVLQTGPIPRGRDALAEKPPWKSAESFLAELSRRQSFVRAPEPDQNTGQSPAKLPPDVLYGLERGWQMGPTTGCSRWAVSAWPPTNDRRDLERWLGRHPEQHNWVLRVGRQSNVCAARVDVDEAREALALLSEGDQRWKSTMQFRSAREIIFLFEYPGNGRRILNRRPCSGIQLHSTGTIFVPPSVLSRKRLFYVDPLARLAEAPDFETVLRGFALSGRGHADFGL